MANRGRRGDRAMEFMNIGILWVSIGGALVVLMQAQALHLARVNRRLAERDEILQKQNTELDTANAKLREVGLIKSRLLANASRELKTPLAGILKAAETLTCYPSADPDTIYRLGDTVAWEAGRLDRLIRTILDLVELESRSAVWNEGIVHPDALLKQAAASVDEVARRHAVRIQTIADEQVPALWGDEKRLTRALDVLLHNAVNYTRKGGTVTARVTANGPEVVFTVEESRDADAPVESTTAAASEQAAMAGIGDEIGIGLGLDLCRQIVEKHNGRIWAESASGRGNRFSFALSALDDSDVAGHA
ncbi:MAG: sensor histidine kinase [Deltaproteobacteria bacterium]|nr:MAG: sensor histidine kinase [Deltaproteobacteria bacterium]